MSGPPRKRAAVLAYDAKGGDTAPRVVAKGYGLVAERIIERARDAGCTCTPRPRWCRC